MKKDNFKYFTNFESSASIIKKSETNLSIASSLDPLLAQFPKNIDVQSSPDLLYFIANGARANEANKNSDVVQGSDIVKIAPMSIYRYITVEHKRQNGSQGVIIGSGFSEINTNEIITPEDAINLKTPFNWVICGAIWEVLNPGLVNYLIECADENSNCAFAASLSWELFFSDYKLLVGSKDLSEGQIITDEKQFTQLSKYLKANGGEGVIKETNEPIYRLIVGEMLPGGFSITNSPAAAVKGILPIQNREQIEVVPNDNAETNDVKKDEKSYRPPTTVKVPADPNAKPSINDIEVENEEAAAKLNENLQKSVASEQEIKEKDNIFINNSQNPTTLQKNSVNKNTNLKTNTKIKYMKFKTRNDITPDKFTSLASEQATFIAESLNEYCDKFATDLETKANEVKVKDDEIKELKASIEKSNKEVKEIQSKLADVEKARASEKEQNDLNSRLSDLTSRFELSEKGVKAIATQIKGLDNDSYNKWVEFAESTFAAKKKDADPDDDNDDDSDDSDDDKKAKAKKVKEAKASVNDDYDFDSVEVKKNQRIPNTSTKERNLVTEMSVAFEGWEKEMGIEK